MPAQLKTACSILIVEDDQTIRNALVHLLTQLGYHTVAAGTVTEGLAQLDGQDCAILDLNLPDGVATIILKKIRTENRSTRVAVASGTTDDNLWSEVKQYKPDLLLRKPFNVNVLLAWLEASG